MQRLSRFRRQRKKGGPENDGPNVRNRKWHYDKPRGSLGEQLGNRYNIDLRRADAILKVIGMRVGYQPTKKSKPLSRQICDGESRQSASTAFVRRNGKFFLQEAYVAAFVCLWVCLSVCFSARSQKPLQLGSLNWTEKCSTISLFLKTDSFWGEKVKGQGQKAQSSASVDFCTLVSAGVY